MRFVDGLPEDNLITTVCGASQDDILVTCTKRLLQNERELAKTKPLYRADY